MKLLMTTVLLMGLSAGMCSIVEGQGFVANSWVSVQFPGQHEITIGGASAATSTNTGAGIGFDIDAHAAGYFDIGAGFQTLFYRSQTAYQGNFKFDDIFATLRIPIVADSITFYPVGRVGYGLFSGDLAYKGTYGSLTGGIFYSIGFGVRSPVIFNYKSLGRTYHNYLFLEGSYDSNSGDFYDSYYSINASIKYNTWNLYIGIGNKYE